MDWDAVKTSFADSGASCLVWREEGRASSAERGIRPLLVWLREQPDFIRGACVADKIVGRAAALLLAYGGAVQVYAETLSDGAAAVLEEQGIPYACGVRVPYIRNREKTGPCPMEQRVQKIASPAEAYAALSAAVFPGG